MLHQAAFLGLFDVTQLLLSEGKADVDAVDACQRTPLHLAAMVYVLKMLAVGFEVLIKVLLVAIVK